MAGSPTNYAELQASVLAWMDDTTIADRIPEIIGLSETRLSRRLNTPDMEASTVLGVTNGAATLPDDLMAIRSAYVDYGGYRTPLLAVPQDDFNQGFQPADTSRPSRYTVSGNRLLLRPYPDLSYGIALTYKTRLPALSDANPTNWLLTQAPDLYLFHTLLMAEAYGWNDARLGLIGSTVEDFINEVNRTGSKKRYGDGPLVARPRNVGRGM